MQERALFLRWLLFATLLCLGAIIATKKGLLAFIASADPTKISFGIFLIFTCAILFCGLLAWRMKNDKERYIKNDAKHEAEETELKIDDMWFVADICEYLGLGGTILGFILLFVGVDLQNISVDKLKPLFSAFWRGAGTAFLTTIVGIFCMLLIKIKARGLEKALIRKRRQ